jgi:hypothetical protein
MRQRNFLSDLAAAAVRYSQLVALLRKKLEVGILPNRKQAVERPQHHVYRTRVP